MKKIDRNVNKLVLDLTHNGDLLPNTYCLAETKFFRKGWKTTHSNNSDTYVVGADFEETGKKMHQLLGRICALCNGGGGIVLWGVDPETLCAKGISLNDKEWDQINQEMKDWSQKFIGRIRLKWEKIEVRPDSFEEEPIETLHVIRIEAYPDSSNNDFFIVRH